MFELTRDEYNLIRCQNGTIENGRGEYSKYLPFAFTENGVAMLRNERVSKITGYIQSIYEVQYDSVWARYPLGIGLEMKGKSKMNNEQYYCDKFKQKQI